MQKTLEENIINYCNSKDSVKLAVINNFDNSTGNIWIHGGKISHATIEDSNSPRTGIAAFNKILTWTDYKLYILDNCISKTITIEKSHVQLGVGANKTPITFIKPIFESETIKFANRSSISSIDGGLIKVIEKLHNLNVLEGFVGAAIIDANGRVYHSNVKKSYLSFNAACNSAGQSFRYQENMSSKMDDKGLKIMILESNDKINIFNKLHDKYILYIALDKPEANLGLARSIINNLL